MSVLSAFFGGFLVGVAVSCSIIAYVLDRILRRFP